MNMRRLRLGSSVVTGHTKKQFTSIKKWMQNDYLTEEREARLRNELIGIVTRPNQKKVVDEYTNALNKQHKDISESWQMYKGESQPHSCSPGQTCDIYRALFNLNLSLDQQTALHFAAKNGNLELVTSLVGKGANLNTKNRDGHTPLDLAVKAGATEVTDFLISKKAKATLKNNKGPLLSTEQLRLECQKNFPYRQELEKQIENFNTSMKEVSKDFLILKDPDQSLQVNFEELKEYKEEICLYSEKIKKLEPNKEISSETYGQVVRKINIAQSALKRFKLNVEKTQKQKKVEEIREQNKVEEKEAEKSRVELSSDKLIITLYKKIRSLQAIPDDNLSEELNNQRKKLLADKPDVIALSSNEITDTEKSKIIQTKLDEIDKLITGIDKYQKQTADSKSTKEITKERQLPPVQLPIPAQLSAQPVQKPPQTFSPPRQLKKISTKDLIPSSIWGNKSSKKTSSWRKQVKSKKRAESKQSREQFGEVTELQTLHFVPEQKTPQARSSETAVLRQTTSPVRESVQKNRPIAIQSTASSNNLSSLIDLKNHPFTDMLKDQNTKYGVGESKEEPDEKAEDQQNPYGFNHSSS